MLTGNSARKSKIMQPTGIAPGFLCIFSEEIRISPMSLEFPPKDKLPKALEIGTMLIKTGLELNKQNSQQFSPLPLKK